MSKLCLLLVATVMLGTAYSLEEHEREREARGAPKYQMGNVNADTINNYRNKRAANDLQLDPLKVSGQAASGVSHTLDESVRTVRENVYPIKNVEAGIVNNFREKRQKYQMGNVRADVINNYKRE